MAGRPESQRLAGKAMDTFFNYIGGELMGNALKARVGPVGAALAVPATQLAASALMKGAEDTLGKSQQTDFARQSYQPGTIPLTNEQAGYLYLEQEKQKNALALLQARENARVPNNQPVSSIGTDTSATMAIDPMGAARAMYTTHQF